MFSSRVSSTDVPSSEFRADVFAQSTNVVTELILEVATKPFGHLSPRELGFAPLEQADAGRDRSFGLDRDMRDHPSKARDPFEAACHRGASRARARAVELLVDVRWLPGRVHS